MGDYEVVGKRALDHGAFFERRGLDGYEDREWLDLEVRMARPDASWTHKLRPRAPDSPQIASDTRQVSVYHSRGDMALGEKTQGRGCRAADTTTTVNGVGGVMDYAGAAWPRGIGCPRGYTAGEQRRIE